MKGKWTSICVVLGAMLSSAAMAMAARSIHFGDINGDCGQPKGYKCINRLIKRRLNLIEDLNQNGFIDVGDYYLVNVTTVRPAVNDL